MAATEGQARRVLGDDTVRNATGRAWDEWVALLDARGAAELPHGRIAALLEDAGVESAWWRQAVAVGYEKRKGKRTLGQTADGTFQVGVRRTLPLAADAAWRLVTSPDGVRAWLGDAAGLAWEKGAAYQAADGATGEVRVMNPGSHFRITRRPPGWAHASTLQVRLLPARGGTTLSFHEERLPAAADRETRRRHFEAALDALQRLAGG